MEKELEIHVPLLDEGVEASRPTDGMALGEGYYKILPTPDYEADNEKWKFLPNTIVRGEWRMDDGEEYLLATEKVEFSPGEMEWLSLAEDEEYNLWELRKNLEETKEDFISLLNRKLIRIIKEGVTLTYEEALHVLKEPSSFWWPKMEIGVSPTGRLVYFQDFTIKEYFKKQFVIKRNKHLEKLISSCHQKYGEQLPEEENKTIKLFLDAGEYEEALTNLEASLKKHQVDIDRVSEANLQAARVFMKPENLPPSDN